MNQMERVKEILLQQMEQLQEASKREAESKVCDRVQTAAYIGGTIAELATAYVRISQNEAD